MSIALWVFGKIGFRGIAYIVLAIGLAVAAVTEYHRIKEAGIEEERARIERANKEAERKANDGQSAVDKCFAGGGTWDRARGLCDDSSR